MKIQDIIRTLWKNRILPNLRSLDAKHRYVYGFCVIVLLLWVIKLTTGAFQTPSQSLAETAVRDTLVAQDTITSEAVEEKEEIEMESVNPESNVQKPSVEEPVGKKKNWPYYQNPIRSWNDPEFDDIQDVQIISAMQNGLKSPIHDRKEAEAEVAKGELVYVGANPMFYMDDLKHSIPYLVPKAYRLLSRIGVNFLDSLASKKIPAHALIVTSVLRTQSDVGNLQRHNGNATTNSCHQYATTFDISWRNYKELGLDPQGTNHSQDRELALKRALGEVLRDLRYEGRCYVKHEKKQSCFHVTVR